jgi:hypothetical protein
MGIGFDEWQRGAGRLILAKTADGRYAATVGGVGMSLPRQVGKTYLIGAIVFALCIDNPGLTVIWTAHHSRTAGETFLAMQAMAQRSKIAPYVRRVLTGANNEAVEFRNGSRVLFGARERGFGRGFAGVDILVCDEAQILTDRALDNMLATMNTAPNALPLFMGTPPAPGDPSESFIRMRTDALSGDATDTAWIECGADPGASPDDRKQWATANPSFPQRTPVTSMLRLRKKLRPDSWLREGLGVWDDDGPSTMPNWPHLAVDPVEDVTPSALGIASDPDQTWLSLGAVSQGEHPHLSIMLRVPIAKRPEFVNEVVRVSGQLGCPVLIDKNGPASFLLPDLIDAMVPLEQVGLDRFVQASVDLVLAVAASEVEHGNYEELNAAVAAAGWRKVGDRQVFARRNGDISALEAVALALHGADSAMDYDVMGSVL